MTSPRVSLSPRVNTSPRTPTTPRTPSLSPENTTPTNQYTSLRDLMGNEEAASPHSPARRTPSGRDWHFARDMEEEREREEYRARQERYNHAPCPSRLPEPEEPTESKRLSVWRLIALTVSMGGSQIAWTVELGYGTPYLLDLGLSEDLTSLVWLAGPISGLVVQPLIGAISDSSTSRFRRRYWVVASTVLLVLSFLVLAYTEPVANAIVNLFGGGQGDWDPKHARYVKITSISVAVFCFYCLDFALNGLQASLRNLVFDVTPADQLNSANAWNGRFNHIGSIVGFALGFIKLDKVPLLNLVGGDQFRKLCIISLIILVITVWVTVALFEEDERPALYGEGNRSKLRDMLNTIHEAIRTLPKPVRRICMVQIAAFMGWFPFLFYSTTYVREVMSHEQGRDADRGDATRAGSFALLIYSFVAITAGTVLPYLTERDRRLLSPCPETDDDNEPVEVEVVRIRETVNVRRADAHRRGRPLKLPRMPIMLRNIWTAALLLFFVLMTSTFFIATVWQATIMISLVGICWAVAMWVPFAMIMEFLKEMEVGQDNKQGRERQGSLEHHRQSGSSWPSLRRFNTTGAPGVTTEERRSLLERHGQLNRSYSAADMEGAGIEYAGQGPVAGGTIMGIHNLAIVIPQFIVAIVASIIFKVVDGGAPPDRLAEGVYHERTGVAWVLRFGGLMALVGAIVCRRVPPTKTEKAMRRRLVEMRELEHESDSE